jgi:exopolyphosphatase/pppGpp-phosphohydrolase
VCERYGIDLKHLESFKNNRADIFAGKQEQILASIDDVAIKCMPVAQRIISLGILYDKERLERGQSTANIAYDAPALAIRYQELRAMLRDAREQGSITLDSKTIDITSND